MTKNKALVLLAVLGNALSLFAVGITYFLIYFLFKAHSGFFAVIPIVFLAHIAGSMISSRRFQKKFGVGAGEYVKLGALPALAAALILMCVMWLLVKIVAYNTLITGFYAYFAFSAAYAFFYMAGLLIFAFAAEKLSEYINDVK